MKLNDNLLNQKISSNIRLFIPTSEYSINYLPVLNQKDKPLYYKKPFFDTYWIEHVNYDPSYYSHFTFVMNRDHTLWIEANLYLIHLIQDDTAYNEDQRVPSKTIQEHSQALQKYKLFCDERDDELDLIYERNPSIREEMPFWKVAKRPFSRPNIKYRDYLQERVNKQEIKPRYAKKLLYPITSFYKFVNDYFGNNFLHLGKGISMPGKVDAVFIPINNNKGLIVETNEGNKIRGTYNKDVGYINERISYIETISSLLKTDILLFPLHLACSYIVKDKERIFKPEYIIPQLVSQYISEYNQTNKNKIDGISYMSTKIHDYSKIPEDYELYTNFALLTYPKQGVDYCEELSKKFRITERVSMKEFNSISFDNDLNRDDSIEDIANLYKHDGTSELYRKSDFFKMEEYLKYKMKYDID